MNCPPPEFADEPPIITKEEVTNNTDYVISALTSLIFTFVAVGSLVWLCWILKDCFIAEASQTATATGNRRDNSRSRRQTELEMPSGSARNEGSPPPIAEKEDVPPSYDSLFPKAESAS